MSDLYTEALRNAEKLREIAEQDAKKRIIETLTPYIKKAIAKEAAGDGQMLHFEQVEDLSQLPDEETTTDVADPTAATQGLDAGPLGDKSTMAPVDATTSTDPTLAPGVDGQMQVNFDNLNVDAATDVVTITPHVEAPPTGPTAPVQAKGTAPTAGVTAPTAQPPVPADATAPVGGDMNAAAPNATDMTAQPPVQGQVPGQEEEDEEEKLKRAPVATEAISYPEYQRVISNIAERIDRALFTGNISNVGVETLKQRLFSLLEAVDEMRDRGLLSNKQAKLQENKLEFLFLKLKEANLHNSYNKKNSEKGLNDMKTLKEFAAQLFEEDENLAKDSVSTGKTGVKVDDEKTEHAMEVSGVSPKLGGKKDLGVAAKGKGVEGTAISGKVEDKQWAEGEPVVKENSADANTDANEEVKKGAGGFGDTDEDPVAEPMKEEFEIDDAELTEAVRSVRKENIKRKLAALREEAKKDGPKKVKASKDYPDPGPEGGEDPSHEHLKEGLEDIAAVDGDDDGVGAMTDGDLADLVLSIDLPPEVEEELAKLGVVGDDLDVNVKLNVGGEGGEEGGMGDEDEIEIMDGDDDETGSEEKDAMLADEVEEAAMPPAPPPAAAPTAPKLEHLSRKVKMLEAKLQETTKLLEAKEGEVTAVNEQLAETNLFTAKTVYFSKFLQRALTEKALSKKVLQQIVEHLDRAKTIAESKAIFTNIKRKLDEHASASHKMGGSSSKVAKPGSASLTEGTSREVLAEDNNPEAQTQMRWQILAGIKKGE